MKVCERLKQIEQEMKGLAIWLVQEDESGWAISVLTAAEEVTKLHNAFQGNFVGAAEMPSAEKIP